MNDEDKRAETERRRVEKIKAAHDRRRLGKVVAIEVGDRELGADELGVVCSLATRVGYPTKDLHEICTGWLGGVCSSEDGVVTASGLRRGKAVVKFLAELMSGTRHGKALKLAGLEWMHVTEFRFLCPGFAEVLEAAQAEFKRNLGMRVMDRAAEVALEGVEKDVWYKGEKVGVSREHDTRMLVEMMPVAGKEFQRRNVDSGPAIEGPKVVWNIQIGNDALGGGAAKALEKGAVIDV